MDTKTSKTLSIIAASVILIASFMPWTKSIFDTSSSFWRLLLFSIKHINSLGDLISIIIIAIPICSGLIIIINIKTLNNSNDKTKTLKMLSIIVFVLEIITMVYYQTRNPLSILFSIINKPGIGFYLALIGNVYFLIDLLLIKTDTLRKFTPPTQNKIFCSNCGKQYYEDSDGQFCEECGEKL
ncbi:MAG: zinc ribbon domain-containing protein [Bacteroidales bacterium]|jgi:hypothetical protein|nr:zinc ribbon domain-containing protein [Bacteroidales bacterium]HPK04430.1 zinc ribbon domain-containing protein [Bacteroidales bacterium]